MTMVIPTEAPVRLWNAQSVASGVTQTLTFQVPDIATKVAFQASFGESISYPLSFSMPINASLDGVNYVGGVASLAFNYEYTPDEIEYTTSTSFGPAKYFELSFDNVDSVTHTITVWVMFSN